MGRWSENPFVPVCPKVVKALVVVGDGGGGGSG